MKNTSELIMTGNGLELTDSLKRYIQDKTDKLFRHESRIIRIRVELGMELNKHQERIFAARGMVSIDGPDLIASGQAGNGYVAIDQVVQKLGRQLRHRHRLRLFKRGRPHAIDLPADLPKVEMNSRGKRSRSRDLNVA